MCWLAAAIVFIPIVVLFIECVAAAVPAGMPPPGGPRPEAAVLVPAHQEQHFITSTVEHLRPQLQTSDRLIVIADNCTDRTAELARGAGAQVIERHDEHRRGKEYALAHAIDQLRSSPPQVVLVIDTDCRVEPGTLDTLARTAHHSGRPVQAAYLHAAPQPRTPTGEVNALAVLVKNMVRPLGLWRLGLPCQLTGAGTALPWHVIDRLPLATGHMAEDYQMGVNAARAGFPPLFCPQAVVRSNLPAKSDAARGQRRRWEHGHIHMLLRQAPGLAALGLWRRRIDLLALGLDLFVPPLALLSVAWLSASAAATACGSWTGRWGPAWLVAVAGLLLAVSVVTAWARFGRSSVSALALLAAPLYVLWKIPIYLAFPFRRQKIWLRTPRVQPEDTDLKTED